MKSLEEEQARALFMFHAFDNANPVPTKNLKNICMKIINACGGLPLSLKVLSFFFSDTKELENLERCIEQIEK